MDLETKLTDESPMPFGKYVGVKMINLPGKFLLWYYENVPPNYGNQIVHDYIKENLDVIEKEAREDKFYVED